VSAARPTFDWRTFAVLLAAGLVGVLAVLPFAMELVRSSALGRLQSPALSLPMVVALALVQNGLLLAVLIAIGLVASERVGL
jgi:hypothetical protein